MHWTIPVVPWMAYVGEAQSTYRQKIRIWITILRIAQYSRLEHLPHHVSPAIVYVLHQQRLLLIHFLFLRKGTEQWNSLKPTKILLLPSKCVQQSTVSSNVPSIFLQMSDRTNKVVDLSSTWRLHWCDTWGKKQSETIRPVESIWQHTEQRKKRTEEIQNCNEHTNKEAKIRCFWQLPPCPDSYDTHSRTKRIKWHSLLAATPFAFLCRVCSCRSVVLL